MQLAAGTADRLRRKSGQPTVAGALDELDARDHRVAGQRIHVEEQRPIDQAVDEQAMGIGIDVRNPAVVAFEVQPAGRDHALQRLERCPGPAAAIGAGHRHGQPLDMILVTGAVAVARHGRSGNPHPRRRFLRARRSQQSEGAGAEGHGRPA